MRRVSPLLLILLLASPTDPAHGYQERVDQLIGDVAGYWRRPSIEWTAPNAGLTIDGNAQPLEASLSIPESHRGGVKPAQMLAPQPVQQSRARLSQSSSPRTAPRRGSRTPYMIGDTVAGTCTTFNGLLLDAELSHPSLACSRLNVSENNSPLPVDRVYFSYRHFHNAIRLRIFQFEETLNLDRFTLGGEHTFHDGMMSIEVRLPIEGRLTSDLFSDLNEVSDGDGFKPFVDPRRSELGNVSTIVKLLIKENSEWAASCGLGITWPVASDFHYEADVLTTVTFPPDPVFGVIVSDRDVLLDMRASNETIYLAPFLAWLYTPKSMPRFFHQGFLQVETPANPSSVHISADGFNTISSGVLPPTDVTTFVPAPFSDVDLFAQTLLRLNLGVGYTLHENPEASWLQRLVGMAELHYTSTLNDAIFSVVEEHNYIDALPAEPPIINPVYIGNAANRVDILNVALGLTAEVGNLVVTNGFIAPIRDGSDRGFDFEYNLQIQRPY